MIKQVFLLATGVAATVIRRQAGIDSCPGYKASNVLQSYSGLTADLTLAGTACNVYGKDVQDLTLTVEYQSSTSCVHELKPRADSY